MIALEHNVLLQHGTLDLVVLDEDVFPQALHRIQLVFFLTFQLRQEDLSKCATANDHQEVEVLEADKCLNGASTGHTVCLPQVVDLVFRQSALPVIHVSRFHGLVEIVEVVL